MKTAAQMDKELTEICLAFSLDYHALTDPVAVMKAQADHYWALRKTWIESHVAATEPK
jgi:hypothetical protein